jgi:hypothetical protein
MVATSFSVMLANERLVGDGTIRWVMLTEGSSVGMSVFMASDGQFPVDAVDVVVVVVLSSRHRRRSRTGAHGAPSAFVYFSITIFRGWDDHRFGQEVDIASVDYFKDNYSNATEPSQDRDEQRLCLRFSGCCHSLALRYRSNFEGEATMPSRTSPLPASLTKHLSTLSHPLPKDPSTSLQLRQVSESSASAGEGTGTTGTTLWLGAQVLGCYLSETLGVGSAEGGGKERKRILELGGGVGYLA